jgi:hypothetical protein
MRANPDTVRNNAVIDIEEGMRWAHESSSLFSRGVEVEDWTAVPRNDEAL